MKKFLIFIAGFLITSIVLQILLGVYLTATYTPPALNEGSLPLNNVSFGTFRYSPIIIACLSASIGFFIAEKKIWHRHVTND
ncbi:hypothetical protein [Sutcliffiella halmapala]|uniref:hypothetical protein n=1 Tax=Sutcliffiella halmapala TaxID=79882 RepID=UPI00099572C2|nr:hypothetical protein [Sutcliffiella halmapala]